MVNVAEPKALIIGSEMSEEIKDLNDPPLHSNIYVYRGLHGNGEAPSKLRSLDSELIRFAKCDQFSFSGQFRPSSNIDNTLWYIYTSGTTGLPKAAKVTSR